MCLSAHILEKPSDVIRDFFSAVHNEENPLVIGNIY